MDDVDHRVVIVTAQPGQAVATTSFPVGHNVVSATPSLDGTHLFILSSGDQPQLTASDESPALTVIDASTFSPSETRFTMAEPLPTLALDPLGHWAVAYTGPGASASTFVSNPNGFEFFDLTSAPGPNNPVDRTIRSFGGTPQRLTFTPTLLLPAFGSTLDNPAGTPTRLLLIESTIDLTLLDMDHAFDQPAPRKEVTVRLTSGTTSQALNPAGLVVDDGGPSNPDDARIALRTATDSNVFIIELGPSAAGAPNGFMPSINLTDVGGIPSAIGFVHTTSKVGSDDCGLRVAALVPSSSSAVLIDPSQGASASVALASPYTNMSFVTNFTCGSAGSTSGGVSTEAALL
ncbi:MAG: hypothetical protein ACREJ3_05945, partial [Polyangiaceae bacterium]